MKKFSIILAAICFMAGGMMVSCQKKKPCAPCLPKCHPCHPCHPMNHPDAPCKPSSPCKRY